MAAVITDDPVYMDYDDGFTNFNGTLTVTQLGRVGINSTEPDNTVEIRNAVDDTEASIRLRNTDLYATYPNGVVLSHASDGSFVIHHADTTATNADIVLKTGNKERLRIDNGGNSLLKSDTYPQLTLQNADANDYSGLMMMNGTPSYGRLYLGLDNSVYLACGQNSDGFKLYTTPTGGGTTQFPRMAVTAAGNVGIGTESPAVKLDVVGAISATGAISSGGAITCTSLACTGTGTDGEMDAGYVSTNTGYGYEYTSAYTPTNAMIGYTTQFSATANQAMSSGTALNSTIVLANLPLGTYIGSLQASILPQTGSTRVIFTQNGGTNVTQICGMSSAMPAAWTTGNFECNGCVMFRVTTANATGTLLNITATSIGAAATLNSATLTVMRIG